MTEKQKQQAKINICLASGLNMGIGVVQVYVNSSSEYLVRSVINPHSVGMRASKKIELQIEEVVNQAGNRIIKGRRT